ncbi:MAG: hypothetical protein CSB24_01045 [Deltaproteobacteria bacterium]|nr:MAG: hypothetical protein CSB24_01045 [Deltaproteobacteria bacterium]
MYQTKIYDKYYLAPEAEIRGGGNNDRLYLTNKESAENFSKNQEIIGVEQVYAIMENGRLDVTGNGDVERAGVGRGARGVNTIILSRGSQTGVVEGIAGASVVFDFQEGIGDRTAVRLEEARLTNSLKVKNADDLVLETEGYSAIGIFEGDMQRLSITGGGEVKMELAADSAVTLIEADAAFDIDTSAITPRDLTVRGGRGDDRLAVKFADLDGGDHINLGGGLNTLAITDLDVDFRLAENMAKLEGLKGITCLEADGVKLVVNQGGNYPLMQDYRHFAVSNGGGLEIEEAAGGISVHFRLGGGDALVNMADSEARLNILMEGTNGPAELETNSSVLTIDSASMANEGGHNALNLYAPGAEITLTGTCGLTLVLDNQGAENGFIIDAFDFQGFLEVTASDGVDEFGLFQNPDVDEARFIAAINDFMSGIDTLFGGMAGSAENFLEGGCYQDFDAFVAAANEQFAADDHLVYYAAHIGGDLYIAQDVGDGGTDAVIKLSGVQHISYADIV